MNTDKQKKGGFSSLIIIAWRNIWRNGRRTALCIAAVGIAVFFIIVMRSWINGMMSGVEEVNASSCFHAVEISYDPAKVSADEIEAKLNEAGYLGDLAVPVETGNPVTQEAERDKDIFFRHTTAFEQVGQTVSFSQNVGYNGRPLWPCPGVGVIKNPTSKEASHG